MYLEKFKPYWLRLAGFAVLRLLQKSKIEGANLTPEEYVV
jgi:hypothetical protein